VRAPLVALLALPALLALAGCGGDDPPETAATSTPTPNPTTPAETAEPGSAANAFIGSLAVDPDDGTLMLGTGLGLFRADKGASTAERVTGELTTPDGAGPVSSNLVVRYAGPGDLLGSGHPEGGGLPENLGLMRSADAGDTWESVAELGEADFHILQARGDRVVAVRAEQSDVQVSSDGGRSFDARTAPDTPLDVAFDPDDPSRMVVATRQGTFSSEDEGKSWRPRDPIPSDQLAWAAPDALYRSDPGGLIKVSADGGATWKDRGNVGLTVNELAADGDGTLYASMAGGEVHTSTDGGASWKRLLRLQ
jgi:Sortilin, neurotensin receptor 3,